MSILVGITDLLTKSEFEDSVSVTDEEWLSI